jgi:hypothetical protein
MATTKIGHITMDCAEPALLAEFWAAVFNVEIADNWGDFIRLAPGQGGIQLAFAKSEDDLSGKNNLHLDLGVPSREAEVTRLEALGAHVHAVHSIGDFTWTVMKDIAGNQFCVSTSHEED